MQLVGLSLALHFMMLIFNYYGSSILKMDWGSRKTATIVGSQKTLAVAFVVFQIWNDASGIS